MATPLQVPWVGAAMSSVPAPVGAWVYEPELSPENTIVSAEPLAVLSVYPLVSSCPFSITRTAADEALMVTLPVSCRSPQMMVLPVKLCAPDHRLLFGSGGSLLLAGSCGYDVQVFTGI